MSWPRTYREALLRASSLLERADKNPKIAEWISLHLLQCTRMEWLEKLNRDIPVEHWQTLSQWVKRVAAGEPYQYIIGVQEFYGREFDVSPAVLIPRPETEVLVEQVLQKRNEVWPIDRKIKGVDIGTGSGAIAITLALEGKNMEMLAVDISVEALEVARQNAEKHSASVSFLQSDILQTLSFSKQTVDLIVSNPPYITYAEKEQLDRNVVDYEPHLALFANEDGLYFYRQIIKQSVQVLRSPGVLAFEVGMGQAEFVASMIKQTYPQATCAIKKDLRGIDRIVLGMI